MPQKPPSKSKRKTPRKSDPLRLSVSGQGTPCRGNGAGKGAASDETPPSRQPSGRAKQRSGAQGAPSGKRPTNGKSTAGAAAQRAPAEVETLEKGDMVVVRMRSDWELEGELRAINDEVIRVFDFAVCDVLPLPRRDIVRIEKLVEAE